MVIPQTIVTGGGAEVGGRMGEKGGGCIVAVVTGIALQHL